MDLLIRPSTSLRGEVAVPANKSHSFRALLLAGLADGRSTITRPALSGDWQRGVRALRMFGAAVEQAGDDAWKVTGVSGRPKTPNDVIDCGNSGIIFRFFAAAAALCDGYAVLTGDESIRTIRPIGPLLDGLNQLGAWAVSTKGDGHAPVVVRGPLTGGRATIDGADSQFVSALLIAAAAANIQADITARNAGEKPWVGLTLNWLARLGVPVEHDNFERYRLFPSPSQGEGRGEGRFLSPSGRGRLSTGEPGEGLAARAQSQTQSEDRSPSPPGRGVRGEGRSAAPVGPPPPRPPQAPPSDGRTAEGGCATPATPWAGFETTIPADWSAAMYPLVAALVTPGSEVAVTGVDPADPQPDRLLLDVLREMGADIQVGADFVTARSSRLAGRRIDCNDFIDQFMLLAVVGCLAEGETELVNAQIARHKECDRIAAMASALRAMGADLEERPDGLLLRRSNLRGADLDSRADHRMVMTLAVAGLAAQGGSIIRRAECVEKTFADFPAALARLGADVRTTA